LNIDQNEIISIKNEKINSLEEQILELSNSKDIQNKDIEHLQNHNQFKKEQIEILNQEISLLHNQISDLKNMVSSKYETIQQLTNLNEQLQSNQSPDLTKFDDNSKKEILQLVKNQKHLTSKIEKLQNKH
jgi:chromosome segregation ATPase